MYIPNEHLLSERAQLTYNRDGAPHVAAIRPLSGVLTTVVARPVYCSEPGSQVVEYVDEDGSVWGALTAFQPGVVAPAWQIVPHANKGGYYYVNQYGVGGSGHMDVWTLDPRYVAGFYQYELSGGNEAPVHLIVGDTYRFRAGDLGLAVLSLYPETPFEAPYEEQVVTPPYPLKPIA